MKRWRRQGVSRLGATVCTVLLALSLLGSTPPRPEVIGTASSAFPVVGHVYASDYVPTTIADGHVDNNGRWAESELLLDPAARRGYQVVPGQETIGGVSTTHTEVSVINLDTLQVVRRTDFLGLFPSGVNDLGEANEAESFPAALRDGDHPELFLIAATAGSTPPGVAQGDLVTIDLTTMTLSSMSVQPTLPCIDTFPVPCPTFGLTYEPRSGLVWAYVAQSELHVQGQPFPQFTFAAVAVNPVTRAIVSTAALPSACNGPLVSGSGDDHSDQYPIFRSTDGRALWTICPEEEAGLDIVTAAVSVPLTAAGTAAGSPAPTAYAALFGVNDVYADPGADRLVFRELAGGDRTAVVFDGRHGSFVGAAGLGAERYVNGSSVSPAYTANGVDPSTGRFYNMSDAGLFLVDDRRTDREGFPQSTVFAPPVHGWSGDRPVAVDPQTRHVFVLGCVGAVSAGTPVTQGDHCEDSYTVYQDNVPVSSDVPLAGLDANTGNVPLVPGSTVAIYAAHAQGFGSRTYTFNPAQVLTGTGNSQPNPVSGASDVLQAGATTVAGQSSGADLTNNGATATGITADADAKTRQHYAQTNQSFPYAQVACGDSSGTESKASTSGDPNGSTQMDCNLTKGIATVTSAYRSSDTAGGSAPSTSPAESTVTIEVAYATCPTDPICDGIGKGPSTVSTATATVQGIDLAAAVSVSYLQVTATSVAGGRSGTAVTRYGTTIRGVHAGAFDCATSCDPTTALRQINSALAEELPGQVQVSFPAADPVAAAGTPKGYYAAVEKNTYALLNDITVSGDSRPELVGMEEIRDNAVLYNGSQAKQVTDFGGVEVESRFGITALDLAAPFAGTGGIVAGSSSAGTAGTPGHFVPGAAGASAGGGNNGSASKAGGLVATVIDGLAWLLDWNQLPLMSLMWMVLLLPAYLAVRRRRLEALAL